MKVTICWMYHDIMNLYGDRGNIAVLQKRMHDRGIEVELMYCDIGSDCDISKADLIFFGGGADKEQGILMDDLWKRKSNIEKALKQGSIFLLICGGYQLFGQYYIDANGNKINGLGFFNYYSESGSKQERCIGNVEIKCTLDEIEMHIVGFENHGGQTYQVDTPLGNVLYGFGNNAKDKIEGFYNGTVIGTYLHGPLLPRNPELADFIIKKSLMRTYGAVPLAPLNDELELQAKRVMQQRFHKLSYD